jgi:HD-GYP domain-containing protein (c-di-GMP phosphodiesterase class II)
VGVFARDVALELGYAPGAAAVIQLAALLHDVGKIGVSRDILRKPERLTESEWYEIREHPSTGERILAEVPVFRHIAEAVKSHHERPDGTGYPDGRLLADIPRAALMIGVADAYSAMIQPRVYREPRDPEDAAAELVRFAGRQFDPEVVQAFLRVLAEQTGAYRTGIDARFQLERQRGEIFTRLGRPGALQRAIAAV